MSSSPLSELQKGHIVGGEFRKILCNAEAYLDAVAAVAALEDCSRSRYAHDKKLDRACGTSSSTRTPPGGEAAQVAKHGPARHCEDVQVQAGHAKRVNGYRRLAPSAHIELSTFSQAWRRLLYSCPQSRRGWGKHVWKERQSYLRALYGNGGSTRAGARARLRRERRARQILKFLPAF